MGGVDSSACRRSGLKSPPPALLMMKSAWDEFKFPTDGPMPTGFVRVSGIRMPIRIIVLGGTVIPIPWPPEVEKTFLEWFRSFALKQGWPTNPDHDKYDTDWRAAYFLGLRDKVRDRLATTSGLVPDEKIDRLKRTENHKKVIVARR